MVAKKEKATKEDKDVKGVNQKPETVEGEIIEEKPKKRTKKAKDVTPKVADVIKDMEKEESLAVVKDDELQLSKEFNLFLQIAPPMLDKARKALATDIDKNDEKEIKQFNAEMKDFTKVKKLITQTEKVIRDNYNSMRDEKLAQFEQILKDNGIDDISKIASEISQRRKDFIAVRKERRWDELKEWFDAALQNYPILANEAPHLAEFETFKANHPKLVSGAITSKIKDSDRDVITSELARYDATISQIVSFRDNRLINDDEAQSLIDDFIKDPQQTDYNNTITQAIAEHQRKANQADEQEPSHEEPAEVSAEQKSSEMPLAEDDPINDSIPPYPEDEQVLEDAVPDDVDFSMMSDIIPDVDPTSEITDCELASETGIEMDSENDENKIRNAINNYLGSDKLVANNLIPKFDIQKSDHINKLNAIYSVIQHTEYDPEIVYNTILAILAK